MNESDSSVLASLYLAQAANMRAFARRRIPDLFEADDLVSEAFRILSERNDLQQIRNPAAFLMTVLHRQINSHLREKYRRKRLSIDEAESDVPFSPDIAEVYEKEERAALVAQSLKDIRNARQQRTLRLYSLNYKAREIAQMETASGKPTTSHQVSCVLQGALANLKTEFRRRGLVPSFIPAPWLIRLRTRMTAAGHYLLEQAKSLDSAIAFQILAVISVATIFNPSPPGAAKPAAVKPVPAPGKETKFDLAKFQVAAVTPSGPSPHPRDAYGLGQAGNSETGRPAGLSTTLFVRPSVTKSPPDTDLNIDDGALAPSPRAEVSQDDKGAEAAIELSPRKMFEAVYYFPEPGSYDAPPLSDQAVDLAEEPSRIPAPECGGLPGICGDQPPPEDP